MQNTPPTETIPIIVGTIPHKRALSGFTRYVIPSIINTKKKMRELHNKGRVRLFLIVASLFSLA
jgi:hypothetical protein